jgi:hypothetical protein
LFFRENNMLDAVEAAVVARAQAKKMVEVDVALQTSLAESRSALDGEIASYGNSKISLRTFLQEQFKSRKLLRNNLYNTIPDASEFRMKKKPYKLRMNPHPTPGANITTEMQISYLIRLLYLMIDEDLQRPLEHQARPEDTQLVRRLPVISQTYLVFPCWEATTEPVHKDEHGQFVLHDRDLVVTIDGTKKLLKSAEVSTKTTNLTLTLTLLVTLALSLTLTLTVTRTLTLTCQVGFALAEYSNGDDVDPVKLTFADTCYAKFLQMEARQASKPPPTRKRRQPAATHQQLLSTTPRSSRRRTSGLGHST